MMPDNQGHIKTLAEWPDNIDSYEDYTSIVKYALEKKTQVCIPNSPGSDQQAIDFFALPLYLETELLGIIVIKVNHVASAQHESIFNTLQQSAKWLELSNVHQQSDEGFYSTTTGLLASCFDQQSYQQGLIQLVTELTKTFDCDHVAFGEFKKDYCHLVALSNSSKFDTRSNLMRQITNAMDEAVDQDNTIIFPDSTIHLIRKSHQILADNFGSEYLCTIPLVNNQQIFGAVTLLRRSEKPFDSDTVTVCEQTLALATPFLALKKTDETSLFTKISSGLKENIQNLLGYKNLKLKLITGMGVLVLLATAFIRPDYRVTADAILEGKVQSVVAAPIKGFLLSASVQAGDTVQKGDVMATLDDSDLLLKLAQAQGQLQQSRREYREALSVRELVDVSIIKAKINQISAEMDLTRLQLKQIKLTAPFNGVVIDGYLSQMLGSPVERGDTLFMSGFTTLYHDFLKDQLETYQGIL